MDLERLRQLAERHELTLIALHGSVARGEERPDSDLDLAVRRAGGPIPPETWLELVSDLQQALPGRPVDLVDLATANPLLLKKIFEIARPLVAAPGAFEGEGLRAFHRYGDYQPYLRLEREAVRRRLGIDGS